MEELNNSYASNIEAFHQAYDAMFGVYQTFDYLMARVQYIDIIQQKIYVLAPIYALANLSQFVQDVVTINGCLVDFTSYYSHLAMLYDRAGDDMSRILRINPNFDTSAFDRIDDLFGDLTDFMPVGYRAVSIITIASSLATILFLLTPVELLSSLG